MELRDRTVLYAPPFEALDRDGVFVLLDGGSPNWVATDARGRRLLGRIDGRRTVGEWLADHGRIVVCDIVAGQAVPPHLKVDEQLWGECIVGALTEAEFLARLEEAGFYGVEWLSKTLWKLVEGCPFYSATVRGDTFEKTQGCTYTGQRAIYLGPYKVVCDEEGHRFPRGVAVEVCTDTAAKLSRPPYASHFALAGPDGTVHRAAPTSCCEPSAGCVPCC